MRMSHTGWLPQDWQARRLKRVDLRPTKEMLETGRFADCDFLVGSNQEEVLFKANRTFLAMGCPVFKTQFFGTDEPQLQPILLPDIKPNIFKDLLQFIYTGMVELRSLDQAVNLSHAAIEYILPSLVETCVKYVGHNLSPENVFQALKFAISDDKEQLKEKCFKMLSRRTRECIIRPFAYFEDIDESILLSIVKMDIMDITEAELFDAVKHWAGRQCLKKGLEITGTNMRHVLEKAIISHIRFLAMTPEEFAGSAARSEILTKDECHSIFVNLSSRDHFPMPTQLSLSRNKRRAERESPSSIGDRGESDHLPPINFPRRIYCLRNVVDETVVQNNNGGVLHCSVTFSVDYSTDICGVLVSSRITGRQNGLYSCQLLDPNGTILTRGLSFGPWRSRRSLSPRIDDIDEVDFDSSFHLEANRTYQIRLLLDRSISEYSLGTASTLTISGVRCFQFGRPSVRDGVIRGLKLGDL